MVVLDDAIRHNGGGIEYAFLYSDSLREVIHDVAVCLIDREITLTKATKIVLSVVLFECILVNNER